MAYPNHCKHWCGLMEDVCGAGLNWRDVTGGPDFGIAKRSPCTNPEHAGKCDKHELFTAEEIAEEERQWQIAVKRHRDEMPFWVTLKLEKPKGSSGVVRCPRCKGVCHYSIAGSNGHLHARCETEGCIAFME